MAPITLFSFEELKAAAFQEAELINKYATAEEKEKLYADVLDGKDPLLCVYGQMTGSCYSERATSLLNKCARYFSIGVVDLKEKMEFMEVVAPILSENRKNGIGGSFSVLENYLSMITDSEDRDSIEAIVEVIKKD